MSDLEVSVEDRVDWSTGSGAKEMRPDRSRYGEGEPVGAAPLRSRSAWRRQHAKLRTCRHEPKLAGPGVGDGIVQVAALVHFGALERALRHSSVQHDESGGAPRRRQLGRERDIAVRHRLRRREVRDVARLAKARAVYLHLECAAAPRGTDAVTAIDPVTAVRAVTSTAVAIHFLISLLLPFGHARLLDAFAEGRCALEAC